MNHFPLVFDIFYGTFFEYFSLFLSHTHMKCQSLTTKYRLINRITESFLFSQRMSPRTLQEASLSNMTQTPQHKYGGTFFYILGGIVVLVIVLIFLYVLRKRLKWSPQNMTKQQEIGKHTESADIMQMIFSSNQQSGSKELCSGNFRTINCFDYQTLKNATMNFHADNFLGSGGFGPVYKGKLADGRVVAVKKLSLNKSQQGEKEFLVEVRTITSIQHKNLVRLLGCCVDGPQRILVYEYMKNRSLDLFIHENSDHFLNWKTRFQIILGVARGLQYLHEDSHQRIVHRDIKASNILLDEKFQPRIGDFGLARFFPEDQAYLSTQFAGTLGYTAPEYAIRGELSEKADIYSFGVVLLEIICCRKNTDHTLPSDMQYLPEYAWKLYEKANILDIVDPKLQEHGLVEKDVMRAIHVAFLCLQPPRGFLMSAA